MKTIMILVLVAITYSSVFSQSEYNYSDNFTAFCNELDNLNSCPTYVYLKNDSIIIKDKINNQCCPGFELKISEIENDTLFVLFIDTATMLCDCVCDYDITLNVGKILGESLTLIFNGETFQINSYDSIMVESKIWSNLSGGYGVEMVECCYSTTFLKIETDPLINTIDEKQILASTDSMRTWSKIGNVKESGGKIYFRDLNNNQGLLYDFGAKKGDIINIVNYAQNIDLDTITVRVEDIDTIEYLGIPRQRFEVQNTLGGQKDYWITGIGSIKGLLNPCFEIAGGFRELLCVHDNSVQIYQNSDRMKCYMDNNSTGINEFVINDFSIYPNPSTGFINVGYSGEIIDLAYSIFNTYGQLIDSGNMPDKTISVNLETGLYILRIKNKDSVIFEDKLLITK